MLNTGAHNKFMKWFTMHWMHIIGLIFIRVCWQELERRLALQEQDMVIVKTVKSEAARVPDMEKELKHLREENIFLR